MIGSTSRQKSRSGQPNKPGQLIRNTYGATLGGPIKKNKLFFFLNYEGQRTQESSEQFRTVPTDSLKQGNVKYIYRSRRQPADADVDSDEYR